VSLRAISDSRREILGVSDLPRCGSGCMWSGSPPRCRMYLKRRRSPRSKSRAFGEAAHVACVRRFPLRSASAVSNATPLWRCTRARYRQRCCFAAPRVASFGTMRRLRTMACVALAVGLFACGDGSESGGDGTNSGGDGTSSGESRSLESTPATGGDPVTTPSPVITESPEPEETGIPRERTPTPTPTPDLPEADELQATP
jgi:hypothetical protein